MKINSIITVLLVICISFSLISCNYCFSNENNELKEDSHDQLNKNNTILDNIEEDFEFSNSIDINSNSQVDANNSCKKDEDIFDLVIKDIYSYIPFPIVYRQEVVDEYMVTDVKYSIFIDMVINTFDLKDKKVYFNEPLDSFTILPQEAVRIPYSEAVSLYKSIYGENSILDYTIMSSMNSEYLLYEESSDSYVFICGDGGMGNDFDCQSYRKFIDYEFDGDLLYIYDIYGSLYKEFNESEKLSILGGECHTYNDSNHYILNKYPENSSVGWECFDEILSKLKNGDFDTLLPLYKHIFAKNEEGNYYWVSSEPVTILEKVDSRSLWN